MKFLVSQVSEEQLDCGGAEGCFEAVDGKLFNYEIEYDGETVRLTDSIGRMVPMGVEELDSIIFTLNRINNYVKNSERLSDFLYEKLVEGYDH